MCGVASVLPLIFGGISAAASLFGASKQQPQQQPAVQPPAAPPQAAKAPEQNVYKKMLAGTDPTLLTGAEGVPADNLKLGKATLLGS